MEKDPRTRTASRPPRVSRSAPRHKAQVENFTTLILVPFGFPLPSEGPASGQAFCKPRKHSSAHNPLVFRELRPPFPGDPSPLQAFGSLAVTLTRRRPKWLWTGHTPFESGETPRCPPHKARPSPAPPARPARAGSNKCGRAWSHAGRVPRPGSPQPGGQGRIWVTDQTETPAARPRGLPKAEEDSGRQCRVRDRLLLIGAQLRAALSRRALGGRRTGPGLPIHLSPQRPRARRGRPRCRRRAGSRRAQGHSDLISRQRALGHGGSGQHLRGTSGDRAPGTTASPASGGAELREQPRPPGCLCLFLLETNAPPARPLPPARAGRPLPHQWGPGGSSRGSSAAALKLKGSRRAVGRASSPRLTSLRRPAVSPPALPGRRDHCGPSTAFGPDWSTAAPGPRPQPTSSRLRPRRLLPLRLRLAGRRQLPGRAGNRWADGRGPGARGGGAVQAGGSGSERARSVSARGAGNFGVSRRRGGGGGAGPARGAGPGGRGGGRERARAWGCPSTPPGEAAGRGEGPFPPWGARRSDPSQSAEDDPPLSGPRGPSWTPPAPSPSPTLSPG